MASVFGVVVMAVLFPTRCMTRIHIGTAIVRFSYCKSETGLVSEETRQTEENRVR